jgi:hypothetical protein
MRHRTAIITAASLAVVIAASTAAIATNLGILDSATTASDVGTLTIETIATAVPAIDEAIETPPAEIVVVQDVAPTDSTDSSDPFADGDLAAYAVGDAGIVTLSNDVATLTIIDIETSQGWTAIDLSEADTIEIRFTGIDGGSLQFTARLDDTGDIVTAVNDLTAPAVIVVTETVYEDDTPGTTSQVTTTTGTSDRVDSESSESSDSYDGDDDDQDDQEDQDDKNEDEDEDEDEDEREDDDDEDEDEDDD